MKGKKKWIIIGVIVLMAIFGALGNDDTPKTDEAASAEQTEEQESAADVSTEAEEQAESEESNAEAEADSAGTDAPDGISPELKEFLDSYEAFMDEYCEFMKNYDESDSAALLKYADLMKKYYDFSEKAEAWDEENMTDEESLYYLKVMNRVNEKLYAAGLETGN